MQRNRIANRLYLRPNNETANSDLFHVVSEFSGRANVDGDTGEHQRGNAHTTWRVRWVPSCSRCCCQPAADQGPPTKKLNACCPPARPTPPASCCYCCGGFVLCSSALQQQQQQSCYSNNHLYRTRIQRQPTAFCPIGISKFWAAFPALRKCATETLGRKKKLPNKRSRRDRKLSRGLRQLLQR